MRKRRYSINKKDSVFPLKQTFRISDFEIDELLLPLFTSKDGDEDWLEKEVENYQKDTKVVDKKSQELDEILGNTPHTQ